MAIGRILEAVQEAFGADIDYAMLIKLHGRDLTAETRYSPPECIATRIERDHGSLDTAYISTGYSDRQNPTMRMSMRRFTCLTNALESSGSAT